MPNYKGNERESLVQRLLPRISKGDVSTIKERGTIQIRGTKSNGGNQLENKREREREQRGCGEREGRTILC
jgi:hypothetical protein